MVLIVKVNTLNKKAAMFQTPQQAFRRVAHQRVNQGSRCSNSTVNVSKWMSYIQNLLVSPAYQRNQPTMLRPFNMDVDRARRGPNPCTPP